MDFRFIHLYQLTSAAAPDIKSVAHILEKYLPSCPVDVRRGLPVPPNGDADILRELESIRIEDTKMPFERQPRKWPGSCDMSLYDGWELQRVLGSYISEYEPSPEHVHLIISDLLPVTFDYDDFRYHARCVLCASPSIISVPGIIEGPARPRDYYLDLMQGVTKSEAEARFAGRFLQYNDSRLTQVAAGLALQSIFYFLTEGEPFCGELECRLFNSHWQEQLILTQIHHSTLCTTHYTTLATYNTKAALHEKK